jgi:hypothetical protein
VIKLKTIENEVLKISEAKELGEEERIGVILLASMQVGMNIKKLIDYTGYDRDIIELTVRRAKETGIYLGGKYAVSWFEKDIGGIALICDILTIQGLVERA